MPANWVKRCKQKISLGIWNFARANVLVCYFLNFWNPGINPNRPIFYSLSYLFAMISKEKYLPVARTLYSDYLKKNKMFFTKERVQLLEFLFDQQGHFSADELMFAMQKQDVK